MKRIFLSLLLVLACISIAEGRAQAAPPASANSGKILLDVERHGEAWYVNPADSKRYFLGRPSDAFRVMRELGVGIREIEFQKIAQGGMNVSGDIDLAGRLKGKILLQVERNGEAWYVNPKDLKKYYLGRPSDAFRVMREQGVGISRKDLARIHKSGMSESLDQYSSYEHKKIKTIKAEFSADLIMIDLKNPKLEIITETAKADNCVKDAGGCPAKPLLDYALANKAFAAINGTYFCSGSSCGGRNYYFFPVYNSKTGKFINEDQLKYWTTGPIFAFDENNKFYYFKDSREFKGVADFEKTFGVKLKAAIGNKPRLIQEYMNYLIEWELDEKQMKEKSTKTAIGYKDNTLYIVVLYNATIPDLGEAMQTLGVEYALNLDGGYSTAMYYNDELMAGPGRDVPNAIVFAEKRSN
jgi:exopolysaccharide biosynthesis protein